MFFLLYFSLNEKERFIDGDLYFYKLEFFGKKVAYKTFCVFMVWQFAFQTLETSSLG